MAVVIKVGETEAVSVDIGEKVYIQGDPGPAGPAGPVGPQGPQGEQGPKGDPGSSVELQGPVASTSNLPSTAPSSELWLVGTVTPYHGWFYNGTSWEDAGEIALGPTGPQGPQGPQGETGPAGPKGDTGETGPQGPAVPLSDATPQMDGNASSGTGTSAARADHVHPTDTTRAAAAELATYVRPNLLDNWYFVGGGSQLGYGVFPVNQRGQTTYSGIGFCIDRWGRTGQDTSGVELLADGIKITKNGTGSWLLRQEINLASLAGKTVTFSALVKDVTQNFAINLNIGSGAQSQSHYSNHLGAGQSGIVSVTVSIPSNADSGRAIFAITEGTDVSATIVAAKLEIGSTQTLAHQENGEWVLNEIPDYATELWKCQKYLFALTAWHNMYTGRVEPDRYRFYVPHQMASHPNSFNATIRFFNNNQSVDVTGAYTILNESSGLYVSAPYDGSLSSISAFTAMPTTNILISCEYLST